MERENTIKEIKEWIKSILFAFIFVLPILLFTRPTFVEGSSMQPTLQDGDVVISEKASVIMKDFHIGEVVIFDARPVDNKNYIKRIIGLPGDIVEIKDGYVYLNEELLNEEYLEQGTYTDWDMKVEVPKEKVFVLGDNRRVSKDSREIGCISINKIKYHTYYRIFPFKEVKKVK